MVNGHNVPLLQLNGQPLNNDEQVAMDGQRQNIVCQLPTVVPQHEAIYHLRRYNGKTDAQEFLDGFETDLVTFNCDSTWALTNIDRILVDDAESFHISVWPSYLERIRAWPAINAADPDVTRQRRDSFAGMWDEYKRNLAQFFDHHSQKETYRAQNRKLVFESGKSDPQTYVTSKLAILRHINPRMTDEEKVDQLSKGLPGNLRTSFALHEILTPHAFLGKLRKVSEVQAAAKQGNNLPDHDHASGSSTAVGSKSWVLQSGGQRCGHKDE